MTGTRKRSESGPERLSALARLPLFFALQSKRAVVAGGGRAAAWKAELLSAAGATVDVYATKLSAEMEKLTIASSGGKIVAHRRVWSAADLFGAALAIGDFDDNDSAMAFCRAARAAGVPVNVIDKPGFCDFSFGAIVNRSPLVIGISTDGAAPIFAQAIRSKLEAMLPTGFSYWTAAAARWRNAVKASGLSPAGRRKFWRLFTAQTLLQSDNRPGRGDFDRFLACAADACRVTERGSVTLISIDADDPDLLTLRAIRALQSADVILFDDRVPREALDFARREASKMPIGRFADDTARKWREIGTMSADLVRQGKRVVLALALRRAETVRRPLFSAA